MKKIKLNLLAAGIATTALLVSCSSENTTGVEAGDVNTENSESGAMEGMETEMGTTDTSGTGTTPDTTYQNPPTDENSGNQDQN